jgi:hypothetical protein
MAGRFDYFVILAGMRTGSNFLEANLNEYAGVTCHGELFNPHFIGHLKQKEAFGVTLRQREAEPMRLIARMREATPGLPGFRLFQDHDPRVLDACLADPRAAKIVLSRNPLDSYVSLRIAGVTGQWRLGDMKDARSARITFDGSDFAAYREAQRGYYEGILRRLQTTGQTAFFLAYDDVGDIEVINGLARFLGLDEQRGQTSGKTKKQNPETVEDKVANPAQMVAALAALDPFDLARYPVFEPRRGPMVPNFVAAATAPLMYLPIRGAPAGLDAWLARVDGAAPDALQRGFNQKTARQWLRQTPGHRVFSVLRHPVPRLHDAFCRHILGNGPERFSEIRSTLIEVYGMRLPETPDDPGWSAADHRRAFIDFATFVNGNLSGQTSVRVDPSWATQAAVLQGMAQFVLPDVILREDDLATALPALAEATGAEATAWEPVEEPWRHRLASFHDAEVEAAVRQAYQRDYVLFGFGPWA